MKERIVITDSQAIDEWNRTIACYVDTDNSIYKAKFEKVPETWEELKELCREIGAYLILEDSIEFQAKGCDYGFVFTVRGEIISNLFDRVYATGRTPQQMWQIIKSLIGEE